MRIRNKAISVWRRTHGETAWALAGAQLDEYPDRTIRKKIRVAREAIRILERAMAESIIRRRGGRGR